MQSIVIQPDQLHQDLHPQLPDSYGPAEKRAIIDQLLEAHLKIDRTRQLLDRKIEVGKPDYENFMESIERIKNNEPLQYVLGYAWFYDRKFKVAPGVLIPRPETEELVDKIIRHNRSTRNLQLVDIGTGSGCMAITLSLELEALAYGVDISPEAIQVAKSNADVLNVPVNWQENDFLHHPPALKGMDLLVSNPPYVMEREKQLMRANVLEHEPPTALFVPDDDPLLFYRAIVHWAHEALKLEGQLWLEINEQLGSEIFHLLRENQFGEVQIMKDLQGKDRYAFGVYNPSSTNK